MFFALVTSMGMDISYGAVYWTLLLVYCLRSGRFRIAAASSSSLSPCYPSYPHYYPHVLPRTMRWMYIHTL